MAIGDEWTGAFSYTTIDPGTWTVYPWTTCKAIINNIILDYMIMCSCSKNINFGAGSCVLQASDPELTQSMLFQEGDEIVIYMAETQDVINKVWGGYVENISVSNEQGSLMTLRGKDYSNRLLNQCFTHTFNNVELSDALATIMGYQTDFDPSGISPTLGKPVSGEFTNETIFYALQKFCDQYNYYFWVDVDKVFHTELKAAFMYTSDTISAGDNVSRIRAEQTDKQYLCNSVVVKGSGGFEGVASDVDSQIEYGVHSKQITVAGINTASAIQRYAESYVNANKEPIENQRLKTKFLPYTDPREYISVSVPSLNLNGEYQIISITHNWGIGKGLSSEIELSNYVPDNAIQQGVYERRLKDLENETF